MRILFEITEKLPDVIHEIMQSGKWVTSIKEELCGRTTVAISDQDYGSEAIVEIYEKEVTIQTAWSKYTYRLFVANDRVFCEYSGAYRGLLEQTLLPTITPKGNLLDSEVIESTLQGTIRKKLRDYAEANLKLKNFRRENFGENQGRVATFDHPKKVYDEFIKEDYVIVFSEKKAEGESR
ncbi:MAG: hypothetical protein EOM31_01905 [Bacteroidia bacterium]|nr:hypothetical protein [Bacteroidia bacterium]